MHDKSKRSGLRAERFLRGVRAEADRALDHLAAGAGRALARGLADERAAARLAGPLRLEGALGHRGGAGGHVGRARAGRARRGAEVAGDALDLDGLLAAHAARGRVAVVGRALEERGGHGHGRARAGDVREVGVRYLFKYILIV